MNFLRPKNVFATFSPIFRLDGKRFISYFYVPIPNNILYLNQQLFIFNKKDTKLCSYCRLQDETTNHIFVEYKFAIKL